MKKSILKHLSLIFIALLLITLTSCITSTKKSDAYSVPHASTAIIDSSYNKVGTMSRNFRVKYTFFSKLQKPSDEELVEEIQKLTEKKWGPSATADDIKFTKITKETTDLVSPILGQIEDSSVEYKIAAKWSVYMP